jgi:membrane protein required for colicin V production
MNALDLFILAVIIFFTGLGFYHGLIRSLSSLIAIIGGLILAKRFSVQVTHFLSVIQVADVRGVLGFILVFFFIFIVIKIFLSLLQKIINASVIASVDRIFGGLMGLLKGSLIVLMVIAVLHVVMPRNSAILVNSKLLPYSTRATGLIKNFVPEHMLPYIQRGVYTVIQEPSKPAK